MAQSSNTGLIVLLGAAAAAYYAYTQGWLSSLFGTTATTAPTSCAVGYSLINGACVLQEPNAATLLQGAPSTPAPVAATPAPAPVVSVPTVPASPIVAPPSVLVPTPATSAQTAQRASISGLGLVAFPRHGNYQMRGAR